ncbi:hypothetical protein DD556_10030 [Phaeobacter sp. JL2872]|nr:hypothetical protein DD556_10030 [Phaeobacter sp. JL2872]
MKALSLAAHIALATAIPTISFGASFSHAGLQADTLVQHGGGCRKSSPPGKCCHMQTSTGRVHCH